MAGEIKTKSVALLKQQTHGVSRTLGVDIIPPSAEEDILARNISDLQQTYPVRYQDYLHTLRQEKTGVKSPGRLSLAASRLSMMNRIDEYLTKLPDSPLDQTLRPRQVEALQALRDQMESGKVTSRGYFRMPPRSGKTVIFSEIVKTLDVKTLILIPTIDLGDQAAEELAIRGFEEELGRAYGGGKELSRKVTIMSYNKFVRTMDAVKRKDPKVNFNPLDYELVVMDEAHKGLEKVADGINRFHYALKLGFTATDKYSEEKQVARLLYPCIYGYGIREGVEEGQLAPFTAYEAYEASAHMDLSKVGKLGEDYNLKELEHALKTDTRWIDAVIAAYKDPRFFNKPTWVFTAGVDSAELLAKVLQERGIAAEAISERTPLKPFNERKAIRERFRTGQTKILVSADLLATGVNEPMLEGVINAAPTMSVVKATQRGGRPLTLDPHHPNKHAFVIDIKYDDARGVTFAQIVENEQLVGPNQRKETGNGQRRGPRVGIEEKVSLKAIRVNIFTQDVLTVLEDIAKVEKVADWQDKRVMAANVLVSMLGQPAETIAAHIPLYLNVSNIPQTRRLLEGPVAVLKNYVNAPTADVELPLHVFRDMIIDAIYIRTSTDSILKQIPSVIENVLARLTSVSTKNPEVLEKVHSFADIGRRIKSNHLNAEEQEQLIYSFELAVKDFLHFVANRPNGGKEDDASRQTRLVLQTVGNVLHRYRQDEYRQVMRHRIAKLIQDDPVSGLQFLNSREDYEGTDFYMNMRDLRNPETVKNVIDTLDAAVFLSLQLPENVVTFAEELKKSLESVKSSFPSVQQLGQRIEEVQRFLILAKQRTQGDQKDLVAIYKDFTPVMSEVYSTVTSLTNTIMQRSDIVPEALDKLKTLSEGMSMYRRNVELLRSSLRKTLGETPLVVYQMMEAHARGENILGMESIARVLTDARFTTAKLRKMREVPAEEKLSRDEEFPITSTTSPKENQLQYPAETVMVKASEIDLSTNYIGQAQTIIQKLRWGEAPVFKELGRSGPDHSPIFTVQASICVGEKEKIGVGNGSNIASARQAAAAALLSQLPNVPVQENKIPKTPTPDVARWVKSITPALKRGDFIGALHTLQTMDVIKQVEVKERIDENSNFVVTYFITTKDGQIFEFSNDPLKTRTAKKKATRQAARIAMIGLFPEVVPDHYKDPQIGSNED